MGVYEMGRLEARHSRLPIRRRGFAYFCRRKSVGCGDQLPIITVPAGQDPTWVISGDTQSTQGKAIDEGLV